MANPPSSEQKEARSRDAALEEKFASRIVFSCKVLRPQDEYPYERAVWESTVEAPVGAATKHVKGISEAWIKSMEAALELAKAAATENAS